MTDRFSELSGAEIAELRAETQKEVKTLSQLRGEEPKGKRADFESEKDYVDYCLSEQVKSDWVLQLIEKERKQ